MLTCTCITLTRPRWPRLARLLRTCPAITRHGTARAALSATAALDHTHTAPGCSATGAQQLISPLLSEMSYLRLRARDFYRYLLHVVTAPMIRISCPCLCTASSVGMRLHSASQHPCTGVSPHYNTLVTRSPRHRHRVG